MLFVFLLFVLKWSLRYSQRRLEVEIAIFRCWCLALQRMEKLSHHFPCFFFIDHSEQSSWGDLQHFYSLGVKLHLKRPLPPFPYYHWEQINIDSFQSSEYIGTLKIGGTLFYKNKQKKKKLTIAYIYINMLFVNDSRLCLQSFFKTEFFTWSLPKPGWFH